MQDEQENKTPEMKIRLFHKTLVVFNLGKLQDFCARPKYIIFCKTGGGREDLYKILRAKFIYLKCL